MIKLSAKSKKQLSVVVKKNKNNINEIVDAVVTEISLTHKLIPVGTALEFVPVFRLNESKHPLFKFIAAEPGSFALCSISECIEIMGENNKDFTQCRDRLEFAMSAYGSSIVKLVNDTN